MESFIRGNHLLPVPCIFDVIAMLMGAATIGMQACVIEIRFQGLCDSEDMRRRNPVVNDRAVTINTLAIALARQLRDLGKKSDTTTGEADEAVNLKITLFIGVVSSPVIAAEERLVAFGVAKAAENIQVGEPAAEEV